MDNRPGKTEQLLALVSTAAMAWCMLPEHQRRLFLMRAAETLRRLAASRALAEGYRGMRAELAGGDPDPRYGAALVLSRVRDELGKALERMRP